MATTVIAVKELDCAAEEQVLRRRCAAGCVRGRLQRGHAPNDGDARHGRLAGSHRTGGAVGGHDPDDRPRDVPTAESQAGACGPACAAEVGHAEPALDARPGGNHGLFILSGVLAGTAEGPYFAGTEETSPVVIGASVASILLGGLPTLRKGLVALRLLTLNINFLMTVAIVGGAFIGA